MYFEALDAKFKPHNLVQIIDFHTWSRNINNVIKSSTIDHVYLKGPTLIKNICAITPPFGDHKLISFETSIERVSPKEIYRRNWKKYTKTILLNELSKQNWQIKKDSVQSYWNDFESNLVEIVDKIVPLQLLSQIEKDKSKPPPAY